MKSRLLPALAAVALACAPQAQAANYVIKDGNGTNQTFGSLSLSGVQYPLHMLLDSGAVDMSDATHHALNVNCMVGCGAVTVTAGASAYAANAYALGAIVDLGTGASPGAYTTNGYLSSIKSELGTGVAQEAGGNLAALVATTGAQADVACATDTSSCSIQARLQRIAQDIAALQSSVLSIGTQPINYQVAGVEENGESGIKANASAAASLAAVSGHTQYIGGAKCTAAGATSALVVTGTITGLISGTQNFVFVFPAGVTTAATTYSFDPKMPIPASASNTAITITLPASGTGGTAAQCAIWGFYL